MDITKASEAADVCLLKYISDCPTDRCDRCADASHIVCLLQHFPKVEK